MKRLILALAVLVSASSFAADTIRLGSLTPNSHVTTAEGYTNLATSVNTAKTNLQAQITAADTYAHSLSNSFRSLGNRAIAVANDVSNRLAYAISNEATARQQGDTASAALVAAEREYAVAVSNRFQAAADKNAADNLATSNHLASVMNTDRANRISGDSALSTQIASTLAAAQTMHDQNATNIVAVSNFVVGVVANIPQQDATISQAVAQAAIYTTAVSNRVEGLRNQTNTAVSNEHAYAVAVSNRMDDVDTELGTMISDLETHVGNVSNKFHLADAALGTRIDGERTFSTGVSNYVTDVRTELVTRENTMFNNAKQHTDNVSNRLDQAILQVYNDMSGIQGGGSNYVPDVPYTSIAKVAPYLYEVEYDREYPAETEAFYSRTSASGACTSFRNGNWYGRNYDWKCDSEAEFVVRMLASSNRHASVGVASLGTNLTEGAVSTGGWNELFKALPGVMLDGVNDACVFANVNVVPSDDVKNARWHGTKSPFCVVRYVLDNFSSGYAAAMWVQDNVAMIPLQGFSFHYMIGDASRTWIVEDGVAREITGSAVMTNFRLFNNSATLHTNRSEVAVYDPHGIGLERYALVASQVGSITSIDGVKDLLDQVLYTRTYAGHPNPPSPLWLTEYAGYPLSLSTNDEALAAARLDDSTNYTAGVMNGSYWQTVHSSAYDLFDRKLNVRVQEGRDWYEFPVVKSAISKLAPATTNDLGGVMIGDGLSITDTGVVTSQVQKPKARAVKNAYGARLTDAQQTALIQKIVEYIKSKEGVDLEAD